MAVKTQAQLLAEVASLLADNTTGDISALDVRTCLNDIIDSASYGGKKVYKALLTQTGTSAPVATILENTLSGTPVWSYNGVATYDLTLSGEFPVGKSIAIAGGEAYDSGSGSSAFQVYRVDANTIQISATTDGSLNGAVLIIEVYP